MRVSDGIYSLESDSALSALSEATYPQERTFDGQAASSTASTMSEVPRETYAVPQMESLNKDKVELGASLFPPPPPPSIHSSWKNYTNGRIYASQHYTNGQTCANGAAYGGAVTYDTTPSVAGFVEDGQDAPPQLSLVRHRNLLKCASTHCNFLCHSKPEDYGPFCCGRCYARHVGWIRGKARHGDACEKIWAPSNAEIAIYEPSEREADALALAQRPVRSMTPPPVQRGADSERAALMPPPPPPMTLAIERHDAPRQIANGSWSWEHTPELPSSMLDDVPPPPGPRRSAALDWLNGTG